MAPSSKANWKSYEAQARLVRAMVAAHPDVKWNHKEICACFGSDLTVDALNHRFRRIKTQSKIITEGRASGFDMKDLAVGDDLPVNQADVNTKNIAKYFGGSTPDGIQFQFRTIKKEAEQLRKADRDGADLANISFASVPNTPSKSTSSKAPGSGRSNTGGGRKRTLPATPTGFRRDPFSDDREDEENGATTDYSEKDTAAPTPSKRPRNTINDEGNSQATGRTPSGPGNPPSGQKPGLPSRAAAVRATSVISASFDSSTSAPSSSDETPRRQTAKSLFGTPKPKANIAVARQVGSVDDHHNDTAVKNEPVHDLVVSNQHLAGLGHDQQEDDEDGEI